MTSIFEVSRTPAHKNEKQKSGKYVGPVEKIPNMKNSFIRHIFNVKRQRDTLHGNKKFSKLLMKKGRWKTLASGMTGEMLMVDS